MALSETELSATRGVAYWLQSDQPSRLRPFGPTVLSDAVRRRDHIYNQELPTMWRFFRHSWLTFLEKSAPSKSRIQDEQFLLHTGHLALEVCGLARAAFLWDEVRTGNPLPQANSYTFTVLDAYYTQLHSGKRKLPVVSALDFPLSDVVNMHFKRPDAYGEPVPTFVTSAGIAVAALASLAHHREDMDRILLPQPGPPPMFT